MAMEDALLGAINTLKQAIRSKPVQDRDLDIEEDHTKELIDALAGLAEVEVIVGIPEATNARGDSPIGNAAIAYIQETGSPLHNIPARPFLGPGIADSRTEWLPYLRTAGEAALNFKPDEMMQAFNRAGIAASDAVRLKITEGIPPPLKHPRYRRGQPPQSPADATPLYDTGSLVSSITYLVEKTGG